MSKKRNQPQPFGSRKGVDTPILRSGKISMKNDNRQWFTDIERLLSEAAVMPSAAIIVNSYYRTHGHKVADPALLNEAMQTLTTVISNHQAAVTQARNQLEEIRTEVGEKIKLSTDLAIKFLNLAGVIQDIMNDFANVGMFAIDACLEPYRLAAQTDPEIPSPAYMSPKAGQPAMADLAPPVAVEIPIVGLPGELESSPQEPAVQESTVH